MLATLALALQAHEGAPHDRNYDKPPAAPTQSGRPSDRRPTDGYKLDLHNEQTTL